MRKPGMEATNVTEKKRGGWRGALKTIFFTLLYLIPLFWLWSKTGFPDSLGVHIVEHGKGGLLEHWWYSYLLLKRHHPLDVVAFLYMWSVVVGFIGWVVWTVLNSRKMQTLANEA